MKRQRWDLITALAVVMVLSCKARTKASGDSPAASSVSPPQGASSPAVASPDKPTVTRYQEQIPIPKIDRDTARLWFEDIPLSSSGIPMILFRLFSDLAPEIWGEDIEDLSHLGLPRRAKTNSLFSALGFARPALPVGMGYHRSPQKIIPVDITSVQIVGITCASCHTGHVRTDAGAVQTLVGGTSQQFDPNLFADAIYRTVMHEDFTGEKFRELIQKRQAKNSLTWIFNDPKMIPQHLLEIKIFLDAKDEKGAYLSDSIVKAVKDAVISGRKASDEGLGPLYTAEHPPLHGGTPGQMDALGKIAVTAGAVPKIAAPVDLPVVWRQDLRVYSQYDGSIRSVLFRNLAAEFGVSGAASDVNVVNASIVSDYTLQLESPGYPFPIDSAKAQKGKAHFQQFCSGCHGSTEVPGNATTVHVPFAINTDASEARANQLDAKAFGIVAAAFKESCRSGLGRDSLTPLIPGSHIEFDAKRCDVPLETILYQPRGSLGYVAQPLAGIWASAPYLHNGSVPTLRHLLLPKERPAAFYRGNYRYDQKNIGFESMGIDPEFASFDPTTKVYTMKTSGSKYKLPVANIGLYSSKLKGNSNQGHSNIQMLGKDWEKDTVGLEELLEYMKTL